MNAGTIGDARKRIEAAIAAASEPPFSLYAPCAVCGVRGTHYHATADHTYDLVPAAQAMTPGYRMATYSGSDPT